MAVNTSVSVIGASSMSFDKLGRGLGKTTGVSDCNMVLKMSKWPLLHAVVLKVECNQSPQKLYHRAGLHTIEKNYCPIMVHRFYYR